MGDVREKVLKSCFRSINILRFLITKTALLGWGNVKFIALSTMHSGEVFLFHISVAFVSLA